MQGGRNRRALPFTSEAVWDIEPVLELWVHDRADPATVVLVGQLDTATAGHVRGVLATLHADGHRHIDVDLEGISFVDGQGLGVLVGAVRRADGSGGEVRLVHPSGPVQRVLEATGLGASLLYEGASST